MYRRALVSVMPIALVAQAPAPTLRPPLVSLPAVQSLLASAKGDHPDIAQARARMHAEHTRPGPAGALPDPEVSFSIQRIPAMDVMISGDVMGSGGAPLDVMLSGMVPDRTEYSLSVSQGLPWPGKRAARANLARESAQRSGVGLHQTTLSIEGDILAASLDLLVNQGRRRLQEEQARHWEAAEGLATARLEQGKEGASDTLRAMQERTRLRMRLLELENQAQDLADALNRLAARPAGTPVELQEDILKVARPTRPGEAELLEDLRARNPEWLGTAVDQRSAQAAIASARLDRFPDFRLSAGVMKGGSMPAGWRADVGVALPLWSGRKQGRVVAQREAELQGANAARGSLTLTLATRARDRARAWGLAQETLELYERELLPQGEAALEILMARFQTGGASFASLVDALNALLRDRESHLDAVAQLHRLSILQYRASLDPAPALQTGGMGAAASTGMALPKAPSMSAPSAGQAEAAAGPGPMKM